MRRVLITIISLLFIPLFTGCAYKPDVQQGNTFDEKQISQLKKGMSYQQVSFILGSPLLRDPFHKNRWDYIYTYKKGYGKTERRRALAIYFKNHKLHKIDKSKLKKIILD